jgi:hypothetical protein
MWFDSRKSKIIFSSTKRAELPLGPQGLCDWGMKLTTQLRLVWRPRMSGATHVLPTWCVTGLYIHFSLQRGRVSTVVPNLPEEGNTFSCSAESNTSVTASNHASCWQRLWTADHARLFWAWHKPLLIEWTSCITKLFYFIHGSVLVENKCQCAEGQVPGIHPHVTFTSSCLPPVFARQKIRTFHIVKPDFGLHRTTLSKVIQNGI